MRISPVFVRRLHLLLSIPTFWVRAALLNGVHPFSATKRMAASLAGGFRPEEAWRLGLLRPGANARELPHLVSKRSFTRFLKGVNPGSCEPLLSDKGIFARYCRAADLPTPELLALLFTRTRGWMPSGRSPGTQREWRDVCDHLLPDTFVVKPARGAYGNGVRILTRNAGIFSQAGRGVISSGTLVGELFADQEFDSFIFQETLANHPALAALSGTLGLQTCRIMTAIRHDGSAEVLYAFLRVIVGDAPIDNFRWGTGSAHLARIDTETGVVHSCWTYAASGGAERVDRHPVTGMIFTGYQLPHWPEAMHLVLRAAKAFAPIRTVGWDVALTSAGPMLVEGNIWYDPASHSGMMDRLMERIP